MKNIPRHFVAALLVCLWGPTMAPPARAQSADGPSADLPADYSCFVCHRKEGELWTPSSPVVEDQDLAGDIHWTKGIRCHDCHGGSPTLEAFKNHRDDADFRSLRDRAMVPAFCGRCHSNIEYMRQFNPSARTDQENEYWTSGHGKRLKASVQPADAPADQPPADQPPADQPPADQPPADQPPADQKVATCVDCHGRHGILAVKNPASPVYPTNVAQTCSRCHADQALMADRTYHGRPLGHDQFEQWKQSVHGVAMLEKKDLSAPTCNDCHGNHGAVPPGVASVANACGVCHGKITKLFSETRMKHKFEEVGLPGCSTCHGNHQIAAPRDEMLNMKDGAVCARCHNDQNPQLGATLVGAKVADETFSRLEELKREIAATEQKVEEAERLGMEVRGPRYDLRQAFDALTNARTLVHAFRPESMAESLNEGLKITSDVRKTAEGALREYHYRRIWLAASLAPILLVVCLLLRCIRSLPAPGSD